MKRVTASQARRNWFRLLDEVAAGEVVVIERKGRRIVLRREERAAETEPQERPDYSSVLRAPGVDEADRWSWTWAGPGGDLVAEEGPAREEATSEDAGRAEGGERDDDRGEEEA